MKLFDDFVAFDEWMLDGPFAKLSKWAMDTVNITPWVLSAYCHIVSVIILIVGIGWALQDVSETNTVLYGVLFSAICFFAGLDVKQCLRVNREMLSASPGVRNKLRILERVPRCVFPVQTCLLTAAIGDAGGLIFVGASVFIYAAKYLVAQDMPTPTQQTIGQQIQANV